jgi:phenylalanyl-tRNA synthetase beta chain
MKVLKSWLQDYIEETLPDDEKIIETLTLKSCEVEDCQKVETIGKDGKKINDTIFDIKVLPDRAHYMLSHRGVAYDLCAILNLNFKKIISGLPEAKGDMNIKVETELCSRYLGIQIDNINNEQSPQWIKDRLKAIGSRSINLVVDISNYVMFDTGQPLHAFDKDKIKGEIKVRFAKDGEEIDTLSDQKIKLKSHHIVIADEQGVLAIAGVKGGKRAEVDLKTKNIILESANFNPSAVRKTSFEVGIRNDSSKRFENEITPNLAEKGASQFLKILEENSKDCLVVSISDNYNKKVASWDVNIDHKKIESILGYSISEKKVIEILEKLECKVKVNNSTYTVTPPFERLDLVIPEDIVDEIGRIEGLDKIKSITPKLKNKDSSSREYILIEKIKDLLVNKGFSEIITRSFTNKGDIEVSYPMASDKGFLRTSLSQNVLNSVDLAVKNAVLLGLEEIRIFEIGKVFDKDGEHTSLFAVIKNIKKKLEKEKEKIKTVRDEVLKELELDAQILCTVDDTGGIISLGGKHIGKTNHLDGAMEINLDHVLENIKKDLDISLIDIKKGTRVQFVPFSAYPFISRDISFFIPQDRDVIDLKLNVLQKTIDNDIFFSEFLVKGPTETDRFDKDGKRSLTYNLIFQSKDRTLTDDEVNKSMSKLYDALKNEGLEVR